jgi:hypothetical protein
MKILILIIRWKGGVGRITQGVKKGLEEKGHKVKVISREDDLKEFSIIKSFSKLRRIVKKENYDILYTQDWSSALPFLFFKNHYICYHGINPGIYGRVIQWILGKIKEDKLIVVSENVGKHFKKANVIHNAVDKNEFYNLKNKREYLGWIKRDYELINEKKIKEIAKELNLKYSIAENIKPEKMNEWYNSLKVFLSYPPSYAGFNLCWLEAKLAGVPLILGNKNGIGINSININPKRFNFKNHINKLLSVFKNGVNK